MKQVVADEAPAGRCAIRCVKPLWALTFGCVMSGMELCPASRWAEMVGLLLRALPDGELGPEHLMTPELLLEAEEGRLKVYWIQFERLNRAARIVIVGLTPGWHRIEGSNQRST